MKVRKSTLADLTALMEVFDKGREIQHQSGNFSQWNNGYPSHDLLKQDILTGHSYVVISDEAEVDYPEGTILGTYYLHQGPNPIFASINPIQWLNQENYVTVHRMSSNGLVKGAGRFILQTVIDSHENVRLFTHEDNGQMLKLCLALGFQHCGYFNLVDGTERIILHSYKPTQPIINQAITLKTDILKKERELI